jgi:hypothetical protein
MQLPEYSIADRYIGKPTARLDIPDKVVKHAGNLHIETVHCRACA